VSTASTSSRAIVISEGAPFVNREPKVPFAFLVATVCEVWYGGRVELAPRRRAVGVGRPRGGRRPSENRSEAAARSDP
jgi:hypothetical protein